MTSRVAHVQLRLSDEEQDALRQAADAHCRSMTQQAKWYVLSGLKGESLGLKKVGWLPAGRKPKGADDR
jgi:hypothetical protein